jgi:hypothetical protein
MIANAEDDQIILLDDRLFGEKYGVGGRDALLARRTALRSACACLLWTRCWRRAVVDAEVGWLAGKDQVCARLDGLPKHIDGGHGSGNDATDGSVRAACLEAGGCVTRPACAGLLMDAVEYILRRQRCF